MPNVILKDENGDPITYYGVRSVTIPNDEGLSSIFNFGIPDATPMWETFNEFLSSSVAGSSGRLQVTYYNGKNYKLVATSTFPDFGIWLVTPYDAIQIYTGRGAWNYFIAIPGGVLISSSTSYSAESNGVLFYDEAEMNITKIGTSGYAYTSSYTLKLENGIILWSSSMALYVDYSDHSVTTIFNKSLGSVVVKKTEVGALIMPASSTANSVIFFTEATKTVTETETTVMYLSTAMKIKDDYYIAASVSMARKLVLLRPSLCTMEEMDTIAGTFGRVWEFDDCVLFGSSNSSYNYGCYVVDRETLEITRPVSTGYTYDGRVKTEHGAIFYSTNGYYGYVYFDTITREATYINVSAYYLSYVTPFRHGLLIASTNSAGARYFDYETKTDLSLFTQGTYWNKVIYDEDTDTAIICSTANSVGAYLYDFTTNTATRLISSTYLMYHLECGSKIFFTNGTSSQGLYVYDKTTRTMARSSIVTNTYYQNMKLVPGGCLICGGTSGDGSLYFYDENTDTFTRLATGLYGGAFIDDGEDEILIHTTSTSYTGGIRYYKKSTRTVTSIYSGGYNWRKYMEVTNGYIFVSSNIGMYRYNRTNHSLTSLNGSFKEPSYIDRKEVPGGFLLWSNYLSGTSYPQGIYYYDIETQKLKSVYSKGFRWSYFEETTGGYYIQMGELKFLKKLYWDNETKTITEV